MVDFHKSNQERTEPPHTTDAPKETPPGFARDDRHSGQCPPNQTHPPNQVREPIDDSDKRRLAPNGSVSGTLIEEANGLTRDDYGKIEDVIKRCASLEAPQRSEVFQAIKKSTGTKLGDINDVFKRIQESSRELNSTLTDQVWSSFGRENIIACEQGVYCWYECGVWDRLSEKALSSRIQSKLKGFGIIPDSHKVNEVKKTLKNDIYTENHAFDVAEENIINTLSGELSVTSDGISQAPHDPTHYSLTQIPIRYDRNACAPRFKQFLDEIFPEHDGPEKVKALLEMMGYSLLRSTKYEKFLILFGHGSNGKSVVLHVLRQLCGPRNIAAVQPHQLSRQFQRASLEGKLVNIASEVSERDIIADGPLKAIVSGETCTVEHKYNTPFELTPYATCWFATNHLLKTDDISYGMARRALILNFNRRFSDDTGTADRSLLDKLSQELPGILNLCLNAYSEALKNNFTVPQSSQESLDYWLGSSSLLDRFIHAECSVENGLVTPIGDLYDRFIEWVNEKGQDSFLTKKAFSKYLAQLGFKKGRREQRVVLGIGLRY